MKKQQIFIIFCILTGSVFSQDVYYLKPVIITTSRVKNDLASEAREMHIITEEEIAAFPVESVAGVLQYAGHVDVQRRGVCGIQTDFGLRGSSFEQVLILLDGVRLNDPQTGHYSGDIPVSVSEIDHIEILSGHGSSMFGSGGFGGVIHIQTKLTDENQTRVALQGGSYGTISGRISHAFQSGAFSNRLSVERQKSDGYRWDTDYDITNISYHAGLRSSKYMADLSLNHTAKDFGANGFYAPYPSREKTAISFGHAALLYQLSNRLHINTRIYGKFRDNTYVLDFQNPALFRNDTDIKYLGTEVQFNIRIAQNKELALGFETTTESILSTILGEHQQVRTGFFGEWTTPLSSNINVTTGLRVDHQDAWGTEINPALSIASRIARGLTWRASCGRVYRTPTFTDLYYNSPANKGDPKLKPEYGWCTETGISLNRRKYHSEITFFFRRENDRIDWIAWNRDEPWQVANIDQLNIFGVSNSNNLSLTNRIRIRVGYTGIYRTTIGSSEYWLKYGMNIPKHHLSASMTICWPGNFKHSILLGVKKREKNRAYTILDSKLSRGVGKFLFYLEFTNLLDTAYEEIPGVPMPGRKSMIGSELIWN